MRKFLTLISSSLFAGEITIHIFFSPTCPECHKTLKFLSQLERKERIKIVKYDLSNPQNIGTLLEFYKSYGIPPERWGGTLALFASSHCFTSYKDIRDNLPKILRGRAPPPSAKQSGKFLPSLSILAIFSAGLLDGINPCSLSLIILLFSLLTGIQRKRILYLGSSYILGSFIAYGLLGMGLLQIIKGIYAVSLLSLLFPPLMSSFMLFLLITTLRQPPTCTSDRYLLPILNKMRGYSSLIFFFLGALVSLIELFCTGQVYFPTLSYIWTEKSLRLYALPLLLLYLSAFIIPLILVVLLLWWGKRWELWGEKALIWERRLLILFFLFMFLYFLYRSLVSFL